MSVEFLQKWNIRRRLCIVNQQNTKNGEKRREKYRKWAKTDQNKCEKEHRQMIARQVKTEQNSIKI
jgi:hypothetical protein